MASGFTRTFERPARRSSTKRTTAFLGALLAAHAVLVWTLHQRTVFLFGDDASYLILARSLRAFGYRELQFIGDPVAARFPPGYPLALAAWTSIFGESLDAVAVLGMLASVSMLIALFVAIRRRWSDQLALLVVAAVAVSPNVVILAGATASEALFTALTIWSLCIADKADDNPSARRAFVSSALAVFAAMTRSAGVTLIGALGLRWLTQRRWGRVIGLAVATALSVGLWLTWTAYAPDRTFRRSYVDDAVNVRSGDGSLIGTFAQRISDNVTGYAGQAIATELHLPLTSATWVDNAVWMILIAVFSAIGLFAFWKRWRVAALYFGAYMIMLAIWPYLIGRFVVPVLPLLIALMVIGAWTIADQLTSRTAAHLPVVIAAGLAASSLIAIARTTEQEAECVRTRTACTYPAALDYLDAVRFVSTLPASEQHFITPKSATLYYYTERKSPYWDEVLSLDSATFRPYLQKHQIKHVIVGPVFHDYDIVYRLLLANCEYFDIARAYSPDTFVMVARDTPRPDGRQAPSCVTAARAFARPRVG